MKETTSTRFRRIRRAARVGCTALVAAAVFVSSSHGGAASLRSRLVRSNFVPRRSGLPWVTLRGGTHLSFTATSVNRQNPVVSSKPWLWQTPKCARIADIAAGGKNDVVVVGTLNAACLRVTGDAAQPHFNGGMYDAYAVELDPKGKVLYSTYLGGTNEDSGNFAASDPSGDIYVAGNTLGSSFPLK